MERTPIRIGLLLAAVSLAGCAGSTMTQGPADPSTAASPSVSASPSEGAPSEMVVTRSGGIAGFVDTVQISGDGTAEITSKNGQTYGCTPDPSALARLRAMDLAAVGSAPPKTPIADGFSYSVTWNGGSASAGDGDTEGIRAEFVAAAAAVVSSCQANQSGASPPLQ